MPPPQYDPLYLFFFFVPKLLIKIRLTRKRHKKTPVPALPDIMPYLDVRFCALGLFASDKVMRISDFFFSLKSVEKQQMRCECNGGVRRGATQAVKSAQHV